MIEANKLTRHYGDRIAVNSLTFSIGTGEIVGFLGPNGAGKSTTMRLLTTYLAPTSGGAVIAGYDLLKNPAGVRKSIGYLPETPPLYPELTVEEYLRFVAKLKEVEKSEINARIEETLAFCGLNSVRRQLSKELSKGYKQRVGIAQALIHKPKVLILDEPSSGLDPLQMIDKES
jgi:ABC-2 type transport system ATP-binding protein